MIPLIGGPADGVEMEPCGVFARARFMSPKLGWYDAFYVYETDEDFGPIKRAVFSHIEQL